MTNNHYWKIFKKNLTVITAIIGITIPIFCFYLVPDINILLDPLSKFGVARQSKFLWNGFLVILSLLLYLTNDNLRDDIKDKISSVRYKLLNLLNITSSIALTLTGLIDMDSRVPHLSFAAIFFLSYTGYIFWWGFCNIKYDLKKAIISILISSLIMLSSIISIKYMNFGYGVFELIFITLIVTWNIKVKK
jgi:hypothetical membrane protein